MRLLLYKYMDNESNKKTNIIISVTRKMRAEIQNEAAYQSMSMGAFVRNLFVKYCEAKKDYLETRKGSRNGND